MSHMTLKKGLPSAVVAVLLIAVTLLGAPVLAQERPDFSGLWTPQYMPNITRALGLELPFTPYGAERWRTVDTANDPTGKCLPVGPSRGHHRAVPRIHYPDRGRDCSRLRVPDDISNAIYRWTPPSGRDYGNIRNGWVIRRVIGTGTRWSWIRSGSTIVVGWTRPATSTAISCV